MVSRRSGSFRSSEGLTLHTLSWLPAGAPRAAVVVTHGYAEHIGRYQALGAALAHRGIAVHGIDFAGHGRSAGRRGFVGSFRTLVADLAAFVHSTRAEHGRLKCGLFGHSVGGEVCVSLCANEPEVVDALALSSPYLRHGEPVDALRLRLVKLLARLFPRVGVERIDARRLSRLPEVVQAYRSDPLVFHGRAPAKTALQLMAGFEVLSRADRITVPLLIVHGTDDAIADPEASRELSRLVSAADVTIDLASGGYHELLNDVGGKRMVERVADWFLPRLTA